MERPRRPDIIPIAPARWRRASHAQPSPRRRARRPLGRPAAARHGIPRRRLPQRRTAHRPGAARPHHRRRLRGLPDAGHARRRLAGPAPRHRPGPRPRGAHAASTSVGARARRAGRRPRRSRPWSGSTVLDGSADALALGARIGRHGPPPVASATWSRLLLGPGRRLPAGRPGRRQLPARRAGRAPARTRGRRGGGGGERPLVLVVEPGTPRGYAAVLAARSRLTAAGWHVLAPCPQDGACPVAARPGRLVPLRGAARPHGAAPPGQGRPARPRGREVLLRAGDAHAAWRPPGVGCCGIRSPARAWCSSRSATRAGSAERVVVTKRDPIAYRAARDASWGSPWPVPGSEPRPDVGL